MLYDAYEVQRSLLAGASRVASVGAGWLNNPANPLSYGSMGPIAAAALDVFAHASAPRGKPEFAIETVKVGKKKVAVVEEVVLRKPFGQLKHFRKGGVAGQPARRKPEGGGGEAEGEIGLLADESAEAGFVVGAGGFGQLGAGDGADGTAAVGEGDEPVPGIGLARVDGDGDLAGLVRR